MISRCRGRSACELVSARSGTASLFADDVLSRTLRHLPRSAGNQMSWFDSSLSPNRRATEIASQGKAKNAVIGGSMRTLIVGIGALGGVVAARLRAVGVPVRLATRNAESAARLKASGLRVIGVGGSLTVEASEVAAVDEYSTRDTFDLIVLATKANDAIQVAPRLVELLRSGGTLLPIQNGGVAQVLADRLGDNRVLGGLSNLGATMTAPGVYEQRNAGHLLIGEVAGG